MSKLRKKQSINDLLRDMSEAEAKKLRNKHLIKLILVTPALTLGIICGGSIIVTMLLALVAAIYCRFTSHTLTEIADLMMQSGSLLSRLPFVPIVLPLWCAFIVGGIYGIKKACNLNKIQRHLSKMKPHLDELLPDMSEAEAKKLRNRDLIKLILVTPALILGISLAGRPIAVIIVGSLSGIYFFTLDAFVGNSDSLQVAPLFCPLIFAVRIVLLSGGFVAVGIYALRKLRNLRKIQKHLNTLKRT